MQLRSFRPVVGLIVLTALATQLPTAPAAEWLSGPEREFFSALGADVRVQGQGERRPAALKQLPEIASRAPQPLQAQILAISDAYGRMTVTKEEQREMDALMAKGTQAIRREMGGMLLGALLGEDSFDGAVRATNGMLKDGTVQEAWDLQTKWLLRAMAAQAVVDQEVEKITTNLQRRSGKTLATDPLPLALSSERHKLCLTATAGAALSSPVVKVVLYKKSTGGKWTALNAGSSALLQIIGVDGAGGTTQGQGLTLSVAQEMAMNLPRTTFALLPDIKAGDRVTMQLDLPVENALNYSRVEVQIWSGEGSIKYESASGLDATQTVAQKRLQEQQAKPPAIFSRPGAFGGGPPRANPGGGRGFAQPPVSPAAGGDGAPDRPLTAEERKARNQANNVLNAQAARALVSAKQAIRNNDKRRAMQLLNQIPTEAPESPAAGSARQILPTVE